MLVTGISGHVDKTSKNPKTHQNGKNLSTFNKHPVAIGRKCVPPVRGSTARTTMRNINRISYYNSSPGRKFVCRRCNTSYVLKLQSDRESDSQLRPRWQSPQHHLCPLPHCLRRSRCLPALLAHYLSPGCFSWSSTHTAGSLFLDS